MLLLSQRQLALCQIKATPATLHMEDGSLEKEQELSL